MLHLTKAAVEAGGAGSCFCRSVRCCHRGPWPRPNLRESWWNRTYPGLPSRPIAYFSAEFALHQSLPIYAGGLGVLAGDHCKEASDLGIPLVGVGFMYPQGTFAKINSGNKRRYTSTWSGNTRRLSKCSPKTASLVFCPSLGDRIVHVSLWCVRLGRVKIYLLDTSVKENEPADRELSARLYGGDRETRLKQEIILGIGGVRALRALGYQPMVWHLNEGTRRS